MRVTKFPKGTAQVVENILSQLVDKCFVASGNGEAEKEDGYLTPEFVPVTDGKEYLNPTPGDTSQCVKVANDFWQIALLDGSNIKMMLVIDEATAHKVLEQSSMKLLFNEQNVVVGIVE